MKTLVCPGVSVNWIVFWNGAHAHFLATVGRVANEFKGIEVKPRAEHPGELPEEPDTASMTAKERETAMAEHKMALDKYWRMNAVYAPQAEKLLDARNQIVQDLLSTRVKFEITQYLEEVKGAEALYSDKTTLPDIKEWIQDACLRQGGRDNRELKKIAKEQKQRLDTEGSMLTSETLTDLLHKCKGIQNTYNAAYTSEHEQLKDSDMVDIFHTALDPERYNEYKVYLENRRRQKPRANATEEQIAQFMFNLNLPMNLQEIYDECKGFQYCEKPPMPNIMAAEKATKGKGNGTKPQKPSDAPDEVEGGQDDRTCYKCGVVGHIARNCSEGKATSKKKSASQPAVQPTQPIVNPMVQAPLHNVYPIGVPPPWMGGGGPQPYPHMLYPNMIYHGMGYPPPATGMAQGSYQGSDILPPQTVLTQSDDDDHSSDEVNFNIMKISFPIGIQKENLLKMARKNEDSLTYLWDTGSSVSLTPYANDLYEKVQMKEPLHVRTGNGINSSIITKGTCPMFGHFYVHPGIWTRVLSVHQMSANPNFLCRHLTSGEYDVTHIPTGRRFPVRWVGKVLVATVPKALHEHIRGSSHNA